MSGSKGPEGLDSATGESTLIRSVPALGTDRPSVLAATSSSTVRAPSGPSSAQDASQLLPVQPWQCLSAQHEVRS